ncbi:DUF2325 domain-containing protein [Lentibacillus saliphilus]|uniref:DUF2325 domain-containing protein n=1 Tax=Lentibacillus saliphilus TaxID=2737028 RepID=UPI001C302741|nr:DUF2325 domain-containing protein [Lentibacillus saliphilus]
MDMDMLDMLKVDMERTLKSLDFEQMDQKLPILKQQLELIERVYLLYTAKQQCRFLDDEEEDSKIDHDQLHRHKQSDVADENDCTNQQLEASDRDLEESVRHRMFTFERKIRGGFVPEIAGFVPEGIIRKLGLSHGDKVYAKAIEGPESSSNHFRYELAEKGDGKDLPERIQYNYCPVIKEAGRLVVEKSAETGAYIRFNDSIYPILLDENDVFNFKIEEGDLIDIAYKSPHIDQAKVLWVHKVEELHIPEVSVTNKKSLKNNDKVDVDLDQTLDNKTVLVIGNEPMKSLYKDAIEKRGGLFLWGDTKDDLTRLKALVRQTDICVFLLSVSGHVGMEHIKQMCKDYDVAFQTTWSNGQSSVIRLAEGS